MTKNLLSGGYIIATIPDAYSICKKCFRKENKRQKGFIYDNDYVTIQFN